MAGRSGAGRNPALTQLSLIAVGRMKSGPLADLVQTYLKRLTPSGFGPLKIIEVETRPHANPELLRQYEGEAIRAKIPEGAIVIALDERGKPLSSQVFSDWIARHRSGGTQHLVFVIGGANGLDDTVRSRANLLMTLGEMTWPHMIVRLLLLEQLYRAQQILAGHPYHRE